MSTAHIHTDGASRGNPGVASFGVWIVVPGRIAWGYGVYLGPSVTNNVAEWRGVVSGLRRALEVIEHDDVAQVVLHSDSEFVVKQISGEYRVNKEHLRPYHAEALALIAQASKPVHVRHVLRELNTQADRLANEAADATTSVNTQLVYTKLDSTDEPPSELPKPARRREKKKRRRA